MTITAADIVLPVKSNIGILVRTVQQENKTGHQTMPESETIQVYPSAGVIYTSRGVDLFLTELKQCKQLNSKLPIAF
jgi:hypothetical protein